MSAPPAIRISSDQADKLAGVCGLLSSTFDGERATAASMATNILRGFGLTWRDFVEAAARGLAGEAARDVPSSSPRSMKNTVAACLRKESNLTPKELKFLRDVAAMLLRGLEPSPRQLDWIEGIAGRVLP